MDRKVALLVFMMGVSLNTVHSHALLDHTSRATNECRRPGFLCKANCREVHLCLDAKSSMTDILITTCTRGLCDANTGVCSPDAKTCYQEVDFTCVDEGLYPDPYDCTKYHYCYKDQTGTLVDLAYDCPASYAYDPLTGGCKYRLDDGVCVDGPVERCTHAGETNVVLFNPVIYYICGQKGNVLYPQLRRCRHGHWEPTLFQCKD